jgi:peptidoglycan/LPS O-acetylase OafA/YrhL
MSQRTQLAGANAVRFWAAMSVVIYHVAMLPEKKLPDFLWVVPKFAGFGVPLFYVLSAFALSYGYYGRLETRSAIRHFYARRFFRIAPLFYVMMAVYLVWLRIRGESVPPTQILSSATFTFNLIPGYSSCFVPAGWSIGVEMLFYAIFPFIIIVVTSVWRAAIFFAGAVWIAALWAYGFQGASDQIQSFATYSLLAYLHYFAAGILAYFLWRLVPWSRLLHRILIVGALAGIVFLIAFAFPLQVLFGQTLGWDFSHAGMVAVWALVLAALVLGMSFQHFERRDLRWAAGLGEASFSIYLWHPFIIGLLINFGVYERIYTFSPLFGYFLSLLVTLLILLPASLASYRFVEKRMGLAAAALIESQRPHFTAEQSDRPIAEVVTHV